MNLRNVSVIVTTYNEAPNIARCLDKLEGFGEIVVVDSFSSDDTVELARRYPTTVFQRGYASAARQKNWALDQVRNDWVLILDADEALSDGLKKELEELRQENSEVGYWIYRRSHYLGRPIRGCGWQRDKVLRFFQRSRGRYEEKAVHEEVVLQGRAAFLEHKLEHYPYRHVEQHFKKIDDYSRRGAQDFLDRGGRFPLLRMIVHPPFRFVRQYVLQRGFMDGAEGLILCLLSSCSVFLKYAKAWEKERWRGGK